MTLTELYKRAEAVLSESGIEDSGFEAQVLLEHYLKADKATLLLEGKKEIAAEGADKIFSAIKKRAAGEPLQYIIGTWDFYSESYKVGKGVLIPRPETELLCQKVIELCLEKQTPVIFDLCSGSGCIGITLKNNITDSHIYCVEYSDIALEYLKYNSNQLVASKGLEIIHGDIFDKDLLCHLPEADVIVSNPPYIKRGELPFLQSEVRREPSMALDGGEDGLDFYRFIINIWSSKLKDGGIIAFECGDEQAEDISSLFKEKGFDSKIFKDYNNIERFVIGRRI